jgi:hypothetical protein
MDSDAHFSRMHWNLESGGLSQGITEVQSTEAIWQVRRSGLLAGVAAIEIARAWQGL